MKAATKSPKHAGLTVKRVRLAQTKPHPDNPRIHPPKGSAEYERLKASLADEYFDPLVWNKRNGLMVSGHYRRTVLIDEGFESADMVVVDWDEKSHKARMISANELLGHYDEAKLLALVKDGGLDPDLMGMTDERIAAILANSAPPEDKAKEARLTLSERFGVPPFSVLDARQGYWQERKRAWLALGIRSEIGRGGNLLKMSDTIKQPDAAKRAKAKPFNTTDWIKQKGLSGGAQNIPGTDEEWTGTSIFDPVLCELAYRWFVPRGGSILDPFAGGSVRGVVAGLLGRFYVGIDLRKEQVEANAIQWGKISFNTLADRTSEAAEPQASARKGSTDAPAASTPVELIDGYFFKRDDLFSLPGNPDANGGKVRALMMTIAKAKPSGIVAVGDRTSTQLPRAAMVAKYFDIPCRLHTAVGDDTDGMATARALGAEIIQHSPGRLSQCKKWAHDDAAELHYLLIPWGNAMPEAILPTASQVANLKARKIKRLVVPCGSGFTLAAIMHGMEQFNVKLPILAIELGADPGPILNEFAPKDWGEKFDVKFDRSKLKFHDEAPPDDQLFHNVPLDPIYEAKCVPFLKEGDCLWIVGRRSAPAKAAKKEIKPVKPMWITGDSNQVLGAGHPVLKDAFDFLWTCPPYFDLERYSDDPLDLSAAPGYPEFMSAFTMIIRRAGKLMNPNSFAGVVVGDIRDPEGLYRNFVSDTIAVFANAGFKLYNEAILVTSVGSLPIRIAKQFVSTRKLGKTHQNVLFFVKGDPRKATSKIGEVEFGDIPSIEPKKMDMAPAALP